MSSIIPRRTPTGVKRVNDNSPNLFILALKYLGDPTQWDRIADLNNVPGNAPEFLLSGSVTLQIPPVNSNSGT